jgi:hypothetical protein
MLRRVGSVRPLRAYRMQRLRASYKKDNGLALGYGIRGLTGPKRESGRISKDSPHVWILISSDRSIRILKTSMNTYFWSIRCVSISGAY